MHLFQALFLVIQIQQLAISKPVEVGKSYIPYPLECNPGLLFSVMGFWVGFYSNLSYLGLYSSWGSINYSLMGPEQTLQPLSLFIKFINFLLAFKHTFWELIILN